jgi:anti-sigma factor (TIGR02949 family)
MNCADASTLLSAYVDGEASMLQGHSVKRHLQNCPDCAAAYGDMLGLRSRIRAEVPRYSAPPELRARVLATLDAVRASTPAPVQPRSGRERWRWLSGGALAGCAATVLAWVVGTTVVDWRANEDLAVEAVSMHVRATLGNQQIQVASSDRHTVKPWLSARLDYSPPVRDFAQDGFALIGGRIDYLDRHPVATLVYRVRNHTIDVYVRPETARAPPSGLRTIRGFNVAHATGSGMDWLAVSDVNPEELAAFVRKLARESGAP